MAPKTDSTVEAIKARLRELADPRKAKDLQRFFKTGPGEYAEGDIFLGIKVPVLRKLAKQCPPLSLTQTTTLLKSPLHEQRLLALFILICMYRKADENKKGQREKIYRAYLKYAAYINNWDLVDASAEHIVGAHLWDMEKTPLFDLARSPRLWDRRIAILATFHDIKKQQFQVTLDIARILLEDEEDLIHKAVGWMLREVGKRDLKTEERFLKHYCRQMPRTMLRYAIEKFPQEQRRRYLKGIG